MRNIVQIIAAHALRLVLGLERHYKKHDQVVRVPPGEPIPRNSERAKRVLLRKPERFCRVMTYGTLGSACIVALIAALAMPDEIDTFEAQIAAVYLTLLIGSNKAFNAKPMCGHRSLGAIATFTGVGLLPATIIHVAVAQIEPGNNAHIGTLKGYAYVALLTASLTAVPTLCYWAAANARWKREEKQNHTETDNGPNWVLKNRTEG